VQPENTADLLDGVGIALRGWLDFTTSSDSTGSMWALVERLIGSIRRECLDHVLVLNERHLRRILTRYFAYYHHARTHLTLDKDAPDGRAIEPPALGTIMSIAEVGGLHHRYGRRAA